MAKTAQLAWNEVLSRYYDAQRHRLGEVLERADDRVKALLRQAARQTEDEILRAAPDAETYQRRMRSMRTGIEESWRDVADKQTVAIRRARRDAALLGATVADEAGRNAARTMEIDVPSGWGATAATVQSIGQDTLTYIGRHPYGGVPLSDRVWKQTDDTMRVIFNRVHTGVLLGQGPAEIARDVRVNLIDPDGKAREMGVVKRLRTQARAARAAGEIDRAQRLFQAARTRMADIPPVGRGVYRSAYKNAMRVTRSEIVHAHQEAAVRYAERNRFAVGSRWNVTPGTMCEICLALVGVYGKGSAPTFPHPHCMCYVTTVYDWKVTGDKPERILSAPASVVDPIRRRDYFTAKAIKASRKAA